MTNIDEVARRRRLAEIVAPHYAVNPKVAGVLLAGSVARGTADRFSDIEIDIFWHTPPTEADRTEPIECGGWEMLYRHVDDYEWADGFYIENVKVDTSQFLVATLDQWIEDVLERADLEVEKQIRITAIRDGQPLYNPALIEGWRERVAVYPEKLAHASVAYYLDFRPREQWEMLAARDNTLLLHRELVGAAQQMFDVLTALNHQYLPHPYHKWLEWEVARLPLAPDNFLERIRTMLRAEPVAAAHEAGQLVEETFALVEKHMPEIDTRAARKEFEVRRTLTARS